MLRNEELIMFKKKDIRPGADLREICLFGADFYVVNLSGAILRRSNLAYSNLREAILTGADLSGAKLMGANLRGADLTDAILTDTKGLPPMKCPEKGSYIAYKKAKCFDYYSTSVIVTLEVPEGAKRSSATRNKCRCSEAKVLSIESLDGSQKYDKAVSVYNRIFVYEVGETVKVDDFNEDRWTECAPGIHHFMAREEAILYLI